MGFAFVLHDDPLTTLSAALRDRRRLPKQCCVVHKPARALRPNSHRLPRLRRRRRPQLLDGEPFVASENAYDWLGSGIYFWEFGPDRALAFAEEQVRRGRIKTPAVVGALLQLGECFDLLDTRYTIDVRDAWPLFTTAKQGAGEVVPANTGRDLKARFGDCALLNWYLGEAARDGLRYDSVRGAFIEGDPVFEGSAIHLESHIQICVRTPGCVIGVFQPRS